MGAYTEFFEDKTTNIYDEDDLLEEIKKTAELFRSFDKALDTFIVKHGYYDELNDTNKKIEFITNKFMISEVPVPRNIKKWYSEYKVIERKTAFQICFVFELSVEEADDFLRRICLFRGFDCHSMEEVVFYYAIKNKLTYVQSQSIIDKISVVKPGKINTDDIIYTDFLEDEIEHIDSVHELIEFLSDNKSLFEYNNAAAYKSIQNVWRSISKEQGLAAKEKKCLYLSFDSDEDSSDESEIHNERKERKRVDDSIWEIYLQLLGLSGNNVSMYYKDRSIKSVLKDNELLHPIAEDSFPDRDGLNKILKGNHLSYERVRKILILLIFYKFWAGKALEQNNYSAGYGEADRCRANMNAFLTDAGYPLLYAGNPYDFIFLYANNSDTPLLTFREYMRELFYVKNEKILSDFLC